MSSRQPQLVGVRDDGKETDREGLVLVYGPKTNKNIRKGRNNYKNKHGT